MKNISKVPESPERVDWRFRSNYNTTGTEPWSKSTFSIDKPSEPKVERTFDKEDFAGKGGMIGRH